MNVRLSYDLNFSAIICDGDRLLPNRYTMKVNVITATENSNYQNIALQRILFFMREIFENSIILNSENPHILKLSEMFGNNHLVFLPEEPYDQILGIMLFQKFSAITEENFEIESVIIGSELSDNIMYTIEDYNNFPDYAYITDEHPTAWWDRSDITTADIKQTADNISWKDLDLDWDTIYADILENTSNDEDEELLEIIFDPETKKKNPKIFVLEGGIKKDDDKDK
jgi:hypothetical protein